MTYRAGPDDMIPVRRPAAVKKPASAFLDEKPFRRAARAAADVSARIAAMVQEAVDQLKAETFLSVPEEPSAAPSAAGEDGVSPAADASRSLDDFERRLAARRDELKWLYCELYEGGIDSYRDFENMLRRMWSERKPELRAQDAAREASPEWYRSQTILGMMLYTDAFAGTLKGVEEKLPYLQECGVTYLHLMPLLCSPKGRSDGGYAVSDFRAVQPELGTMDDLEDLADACRSAGMSICLDFVMNHTSEEHEWAKRARAGEPGYRDRYFFYDSWDIPREFEKTVPQVFPTTAPGSFTELPDTGQIVMTSFYPYQWDLNYGNPRVFNDMTENLLYLANRGIDVIRLDAIPYIWKQLGTSCRNLPQVHTLARMMRLACETVCPGVALLGEVVMEPVKVAPYFGTYEKPECHMLYNVTTMCTTWHTLATGDIGLLKHQMETIYSLPRSFLFLNYLRCHDDIGWGLDYPWLLQHRGQQEVPHKKFLNDWFTGRLPESPSLGELYNDDPRLGDARLCGTAASLTGLESAVRSGTPEDVDRAVSVNLMLHAWMLSQSGIPVIYSGDEVGRFNDWSYHDSPDRAADSRYIHRGSFQWDLAAQRHTPGTYQQKLFDGLRKLETIRAHEPCFSADAEVQVVESCSNRVLAVSRRMAGREVLCLFNFSPEPAAASVLREGSYADLCSGQEIGRPRGIRMEPRSFLWLVCGEA